MYEERSHFGLLAFAAGIAIVAMVFLLVMLIVQRQPENLAGDSHHIDGEPWTCMDQCWHDRVICNHDCRFSQNPIYCENLCTSAFYSCKSGCEDPESAISNP